VEALAPPCSRASTLLRALVGRARLEARRARGALAFLAEVFATRARTGD
jgi:hypothetical protein